MRTSTVTKSPDLLAAEMTPASPAKCWIAVASADHVRRGVQDSIMQVCHGKAAPLRRVRPGDRVAYYSPSTGFRGADKLQAFTAYGRVTDGEPYVFDMGGGFRPYRRDVAWERARTTLIRPLLDVLAFTSGDRNWGYKLRFGLFEIGDADMDLIERAMSERRQPAAEATIAMAAPALTTALAFEA
jgi:hypothetical protein